MTKPSVTRLTPPRRSPTLREPDSRAPKSPATVRHRMHIVSRAALIPLLLVACGPPAMREGRPTVLDPSASAERFLRAANGEDLQTMAQLFGTSDGSVLLRDRHAEVEERMFALASLLRHDDFAFAAERQVPGRSGEAVEILVDMRLAAEEEVRVPFTMVREREGGWLVERIDIEVITARR